MKIFKSHFWYSKRHRNGIFALVLLVVVLQVYYYSIGNPQEVTDSTSSSELIRIRRQLDSLSQLKTSVKRTLYPFNPNYLNEGSAYFWGLSLSQWERLQTFRKEGGYLHSFQQFKTVAKLTDSLARHLQSYSYFTSRKQYEAQTQSAKKKPRTTRVVIKRYSPAETSINRASANDFIRALGLEADLAKRIVNYRRKIIGFTYKSQLEEVWGLSKINCEQIWTVFSLKHPPHIEKKNVNDLTFRELVRIPYVDYKTAKMILDYKEEVAEIQNIEDLQNISNFPMKKYNRIVLYLLAE
jgi:DNA uptake protein ComE-like DNA-binding protein